MVARLTLAQSRAEMGRLAAWLDLQERLMAMPGSVALAVRQCLEEAVANLIDHTSATAGKGITVELEWQDDMLVATVEDHGPPFDLRDVPVPMRPASLETVEPGGWGIHLIRSFASDIGYDTVPGANRLRMRFARPH
jgi:anti-sigma regulatory factor (Ser/Thr protein kinase)